MSMYIEKTKKCLPESRVGGFWTVPVFFYRGIYRLNTVLGKTGFGHSKWEKPEKAQLMFFSSNLVYQ